jgi:hypothetical protein
VVVHPVRYHLKLIKGLWGGFGMMRCFIGLVFVTLLCGGAVPAVAESDPRPTLGPGAKPLDDAGIRATLGNGVTFAFTGLDTPIVGTSTWDPGTGTAFGTFAWDGKIRGTWSHKWFVRDDRSCLQFSATRTVCERIYRHGDGFLEVNEDGAIHTVSTPTAPPPLAEELTADEVERMLTRILVWLETPDVEVGHVDPRDGHRLIAQIVHKDGSPAWKLEIDRRTGVMRGIP